MNTQYKSRCIWWGIAALFFAPVLLADTTVFPFELETTISDPCAVFNVSTTNPKITRLQYGETINFNLKGTSQSIIDVDATGKVNLKFMINTHGAGIGQTSEIKYQFNSKSLVQANTNGGDPNDPNFVFNGKFKIDAKIIGQGNDASQGGIAQGAQDNALLHFYVTVHYANGEIQSTGSDFTLECVGSPWSNLMKSPQAGSKVAVGRGFGDPWNKYAWSMKDFNGGMVVGTKNAFYDFQTLLNPPLAVQTCINTPLYRVTSIHLPLACMELFDAPPAADTRYADIWRFDYAKSSWTKTPHDAETQGFRIMETHNGKLYVGSDLGAFITGVAIPSNPGSWNFPGSKVLVSTDGKTFQNVSSCKGTGPCNSYDNLANPYGIFPDLTTPQGAVNTSIRAMASFDGKLYVGTFNALGAELWSYNDQSNTWAFVKKWIIAGPSDPAPKAAVAELRVYNNKLYIGLAGPAGNSYLWSCSSPCTASDNSPQLVSGQPDLGNTTNVGTLKLFASSKGLLYIGNVDLSNGFYLQAYDGSTFREITNNGFFNTQNAYAWSMIEVNGRILVGTFNQDFLTTLPRGSAELWYSDDSTNWQQMALPLDWGLWNYGIRTMEVGNKMLFLGSASNMIAPDLISQPVPLSPGAEVWAIRNTAVAPTGKSSK